MKKPILMAMIAAGLLSCGGEGPRYVDPLLLPFVEEFEAAAGFPVSSSVGFAPLALVGELGLCDPESSTVFIADLFRDAPDVFVPWLWHELGHCELGRGHVGANDYVQIGDYFITSSVMSLAPPGDSVLAMFSDYYACELIHGSTDCLPKP